MKIKNIFLSVAVLGHIGINAADSTISLENKTISELIEQMQQAKIEDRYKFMNAIKAKISKLNERKREEKIKEIEKEIEAKKEKSVEREAQKAKNTKGVKNHSISTSKDARQNNKEMGFGGFGRGMGMGGIGGMGGGHGGGHGGGR